MSPFGLPSLLRFVFEEKLELGPGMATRLAKAPAGITAFIGESNGFPQREAEGLRPRIGPGKDHCLVISRCASKMRGEGGIMQMFRSLLFAKADWGDWGVNFH
jgi:hypothetical protein